MAAKRSATIDLVVTLAALAALPVLLVVAIGATMNGGPRVLFASITVFAAATAGPDGPRGALSDLPTAPCGRCGDPRGGCGMG